MVLEFYICLFASFQLLTSALVCKKGQHCFNCSADGSCVSACQVGYYGQFCNHTCSDNCLHGKCTDGNPGVEKCTLGCKPGYFGSRCNVPCTTPSVNDPCKKCPQKCNEGFCDLGTSCMSGCVDGYYGAEGCHSYVVKGEVSTDTKLCVSPWILLTAGAGISLYMVVSIVVLIKLMKKRRQPASSEYCQTLRQDVTEDYTELRRSEIGRYIHAVDDPNDGP